MPNFPAMQYEVKIVCTCICKAVEAHFLLLSDYTGIMCPALTNPVNGQVSFSLLTLGAEAEYVCDEGYALDSDPIRMCEGEGSWSGNDPLCLSK